MQERGFNNSKLGKELDVSREAVSQWLSGKSLPRPKKLLDLALALDSTVSQLTSPAESQVPVIAFRKRGAGKTTESHRERAQQMGLLLKPIVPHLPFDSFVAPQTLKEPVTDYPYLQALALKLRKDLGVGEYGKIDFSHLIKHFTRHQAVLIPVLWANKSAHENALHIYLPDSRTTWVYLNLDVEVHDFKFWMTHELGHILSPQLRGNEAEDFADAFAGALLFPEPLAEVAYKKIRRKSGAGAQINAFKQIAEEHTLSPYTVYCETNKYADSRKLSKFSLEPQIHGASKNLSKEYYSVSESLFGEGTAEPSALIKFANREFDSPFFDALKAYLVESGKGAGYLQSILNIPVVDAQALRAELA